MTPDTHPYLARLSSLHAKFVELMQMVDTDLPTDWFPDEKTHEAAELEHARWWSVIDMVRDAIAREIVDVASVVEEIKDSVFDQLLSEMQQLKKELATAKQQAAERQEPVMLEDDHGDE